MKAKNLLLTLAVGAIAMSCNSGSMTGTKVALKSDADSASYYIGYLYGTGLQRTGFTEPNIKAVTAGLNAALKKEKMETTPQDMEMFLNMYFQKLVMQKAAENLKKGQEFMAQNAKKSGIDSLPGGIQYKIEKEGTGAKPAPTDVVKVHYKGTFINGEQFDSSIDRGEPAELSVNGVIRGWTEVLQQMPVGSKWTVYIPAELAYGERGGGPIGPNETLVFELELLDIVTPAQPAE